MSYDIVIIGAGIAGIHTGIELLRSHPFLRCTILEKYNYNGGRVFTFHKSLPGIGRVQWESGAGRIASSHHMIRALMKRYDLTFLPISGESKYIPESTLEPQENRFNALHDVYLEPLRSLPTEVLQTHTLGSLITQIHGSSEADAFLSQFPYFSEIHTLRADLALHSFDHEMGQTNGFGVCKEGLSMLTDRMAAEFLKRGGTIQHDSEVVSVSYDGKSHEICVKNGPTYTSPLCIMALHSEAMKHIQGVSHLPVLKKLEMTPLYRMYAVFPVSKGKSWFHGLPKFVSDSPIRYILPINERTIMITYTDGDDALFWMNKNPKQVPDQVMKRIRGLFPDLTIPDPLFFKMHPWKQGCTYWKPGKYSVEDESRLSLHPLPKEMPGLFVCGESFSLQQCWMEGAVQQAQQMMKHPAFQRVLKSVLTL